MAVTESTDVPAACHHLPSPDVLVQQHTWGEPVWPHLCIQEHHYFPASEKNPTILHLEEENLKTTAQYGGKHFIIPFLEEVPAGNTPQTRAREQWHKRNQQNFSCCPFPLP